MKQHRLLFAFLALWAISITIFATYLSIRYAGRVAVPPEHSISQERWHYHPLQPDEIAGVCDAFLTTPMPTGGTPVACVFKNYIKDECHIFYAPTAPGARFAFDYEQKRCNGFDIKKETK